MTRTCRSGEQRRQGREEGGGGEDKTRTLRGERRLQLPIAASVKRREGRSEQT